MKAMDWDGLRLFSVVAQTGSLAAAALATGISAPTLGRSMAALEVSLGRKLFIRHQRGYELAADGRALLDYTRDMETIAGEIDAWSSGAYQLPNVTISAGTWVSRFLANNLKDLWTPADSFRLCFKTSEARLDIDHREADIGVRNVRPQTGNLAVRKAVQVAFAVYAHNDFDTTTHDNWVSIGREEGITPSSNWVHSQPELWITNWVSTPIMLLDLLRGGAGKGVLPCFIGDAEADLRRVSEPIAELEHTMWLVVHDDERRRSEKRVVMDRLTQLIKSHAALFSGDRTL